jgi:hypothetical protein
LLEGQTNCISIRCADRFGNSPFIESGIGFELELRPAPPEEPVKQTGVVAMLEAQKAKQQKQQRPRRPSSSGGSGGSGGSALSAPTAAVQPASGGGPSPRKRDK